MREGGGENFFSSALRSLSFFSSWKGNGEENLLNEIFAGKKLELKIFVKYWALKRFDLKHALNNS